MKLAAQLFTVRVFTNTDKEVRETLTKIRKIGSAIEQDTYDGDPFDSLKKSFENLQKHGLFIGK